MDFSKLFTELKNYRGKGAFNQYAQVDPELDVPDSDRIRLENLKAYLDTFSEARIVLVGESPSFHGCRFSGIPFTAEEQIAGASPLDWARDGIYRRTSRRKKLMSEHSGSIVWELLGNRRDVVLWNAFPWHSHRFDDKTRNRKPDKAEIKAAAKVLGMFTGLFPNARVYAVGRTAEHALNEIGVDAGYIRHPARGGKTLFKEGIARILFRAYCSYSLFYGVFRLLLVQ